MTVKREVMGEGLQTSLEDHRGNVIVSFATTRGETMGSLSKPSCQPVVTGANVEIS